MKNNEVVNFQIKYTIIIMSVIYAVAIIQHQSAVPFLPQAANEQGNFM